MHNVARDGKWLPCVDSRRFDFAAVHAVDEQGAQVVALRAPRNGKFARRWHGVAHLEGSIGAAPPEAQRLGLSLQLYVVVWREGPVGLNECFLTCGRYDAYKAAECARLE